MKKILYFLVFNLMFVAVASTQETLNGAFVSELNEILIIEDNAVAYNILSHDAFNTHYVGLHKVSTLISIEEKKLDIVLDTNILKTSFVTILPNQSDNFAQISLEFNSGKPISFATYLLSIFLDDTVIYFNNQTSAYGQIFVDLSKYKQNEILAKLYVSTIGYYTLEYFELKKGYKYMIKSLMSENMPINYGLKEIKLKIIDNNSIIATYGDPNDLISVRLIRMKKELRVEEIYNFKSIFFINK